MNYSSPDVSIIVPSYNCLAYLEACCASVQAQGLDDYELIIIDDGSTDGSWEYLQQAASTNPHLCIYRAERIGVGAARNLGVSIARAKYIAFLDADDTWYAGKLGPQLEYMKRSGAVLSFTDYDHVREGSQTPLCGCFEFWPQFGALTQGQGSDNFYNLATPLAYLLAENVVGTSTVVVRRDVYLAVGGFDTKLNSASDWDLWLKLAAAGYVGYRCARMTAYLIREGSISRNQGKRLAAMEGIIAEHARKVRASQPEAVEKAYARLALGYQEFYTSEGLHFRALRCALQALYRLPTRRNLRASLACIRNLLLSPFTTKKALPSG